MKAQFDQNVLSSFYLWFENKLLSDKAKAYAINLDNAFTSGNFPDIPSSHIAFQGKYRSLVGEYDIDQPNSGFFLGNHFITGNYDQNGEVFTDYENGRLIFPKASGAAIGNTALTANSTVKEVNTYITNDTDAQVIFIQILKIVQQNCLINMVKLGNMMKQHIFYLLALSLRHLLTILNFHLVEKKTLEP